MTPEDDALAALYAENARLIALLEAHGIEWRAPETQSSPPPFSAPAKTLETSRLTPAEKVALFRRLFRGREDVYPVRWESKTSGKSGYSPTCANEWWAGVCEKPRIKCGECSKRLFVPLTDSIVYDHLAGEHIIGVYPLLADDTCHFLAAVGVGHPACDRLCRELSSSHCPATRLPERGGGLAQKHWHRA